MLAEGIRILKTKADITATDAAIILPGNIMPFRIVTLPYMSGKELAREAKEPEFWSDIDVDIGKYSNPLIRYHILEQSENDDMTRLLVSYAEDHLIQPWLDIILAAHLNPVFLENEWLSLANLRYATLSPVERHNAHLIFQLNNQGCTCIAFEGHRAQTVKIEINDFDLILIEQAEEATQLEGQFWDDVIGRLANAIKQAVLYLQEEHDFSPFAQLHLISEYSRCHNIITMLDAKLELVDVRLWNPFNDFRQTKTVTEHSQGYANPSVMASAIGIAMEKLNIYGETMPLPFCINMHPQEVTLRRNRQLNVITTCLIRLMIVIFILLGSFTALLSLPSYLASSKAIHHVDALQQDTDRLTLQVKSIMKSNTEYQQQIVNFHDQKVSATAQAFLLTLPDIIPDAVELDEIVIMGNPSTVRISGFARSEEAVSKLQKDIVDTALLTDIKNDVKTAPPYQRFRISGTLISTQ
jgi:Tfp pilus assembly protein PilN